jgi:hypothetical protein
MSHAQRKRTGNNGQERVANLLYSYGRYVELMPEHCHYDLLVDHVHRCEVKTAKPAGRGDSLVWQFKLVRNGALIEEADFYIFRCEDVPYCSESIHLLRKAPLGVKTVAVSFRGLLNGLGKYAQAFREFAKGEVYEALDR